LLCSCGSKSNNSDEVPVDIVVPIIPDPIVVINVLPEPEGLGIIPTGQDAGEILKKSIGGVDYTFRWIPAGLFFMGAPDSDLDQFLVIDITDTLVPIEQPRHQVTLTVGFWMHETEITQKQWGSLISENPSDFLGDNLPVVNVSHEDITKMDGFIEKLHKQSISSNKFLLPTEAQWEYAYRADTITKYYWGDNNSTTELDKYCWYSGNSNNSLQEVGLKLENPWGLKDMSGNAYEVVIDFSSTYLNVDTVDPTGPTTGTIKIYRGGSFKSDAANCRSTNRIIDHIDLAYDNQGFRIVLLPD